MNPGTKNLGALADAGAVPTDEGPDRVRTSGGRCGQAEYTHDMGGLGASAINASGPAEYTAAHTRPLRRTRV